MQERAALMARLEQLKALESELTDCRELHALAREENDEALLAEIDSLLAAIEPRIAKQRLETLLNQKSDQRNAFIEIHAGAGGTEAQDWAEMIRRMYARWAEKRGFTCRLLSESSGEEAGILSATMMVSGHNAYGWLKTEKGVHRLVRISPFDANGRRHTSFCSVDVYPDSDEETIEINEKDLRIDTYRASGAGGQHVNRTDSAVRITHNPTGVVVQCQDDRSQHKNRAQAMKMLSAKLEERQQQEQRQQKQDDYQAKTDIAWGSQIRNYVLYPYRLVKDVRTQIESPNPQHVLDGDLDAFLEAALERSATESSPSASSEA